MTALPGLTVRPRFAATRCAVCHDDLLAPGTTCPRCGTVAHPECRAELARCPTLACSPPARGPGMPAVRRAARLPWHPADLIPGDLTAFVIALVLALTMLVGAIAAFRGSLSGSLRHDHRLNLGIVSQIK